IDIIQFPFNVFDNLNYRQVVIQKAKDRGKIVHTRSCFLQGLFFMPLTSEHVVVRHLENELSMLTSISKRSRISLSKIALGYCLQQNLIDNVLIGVDSIEQLKQNLVDAEFTLPHDVIE